MFFSTPHHHQPTRQKITNQSRCVDTYITIGWRGRLTLRIWCLFFLQSSTYNKFTYKRYDRTELLRTKHHSAPPTMNFAQHYLLKTTFARSYFYNVHITNRNCVHIKEKLTPKQRGRFPRRKYYPVGTSHSPLHPLR